MRTSLKRLADLGLGVIAKTPARVTFEKASRRYLHIVDPYSFDFKLNGEAALVKHCLTNLFVHPTVFDVGGNVGDWTELVLEHSKQAAEVHVFEMSAAMFDLLTCRFQRESRVHLNRVAVADETGFAEMQIYEDAEVLNSIVPGTHRMEERRPLIAMTPTIRGVDYCLQRGIEGIDLLKIDVEGAEDRVLRGVVPMLKEAKIGVVQFEYAYQNAYSSMLMHDFWSLFHSMGYSVGRLNQWGVSFSEFQSHFDNFDSGPNYVAALPTYVDALREFPKT